MRKFLIAAAATALLLPQMAFALSLGEAKAGGLVGEKPTGYLGVVQSSTEANALVTTINDQRRAEYDRIAKQNNQSRTIVEKLAAKKAYDLTPKGQYIQAEDGSWQQK
jgi:hypothetical protein